MGHIVRAFQGIEVVTELGPFDQISEARDEAQNLADMMGEGAQVFVEDADEVAAAIEHQQAPDDFDVFPDDPGLWHGPTRQANPAYPRPEQMALEIWKKKGPTYDSRSEPGARMGWMIGPQLAGQLWDDHRTMVVYPDGLSAQELQTMYDYYIRDPHYDRKKNHHLQKGERAKYSDEVLRHAPYPEFESHRMTVVEAKPDGYMVSHDTHPHKRPTYLGDRDLVSARSTSRFWPGNNFEGLPPRRNPTWREGLQVVPHTAHLDRPWFVWHGEPGESRYKWDGDAGEYHIRQDKGNDFFDVYGYKPPDHPIEPNRLMYLGSVDTPKQGMERVENFDSRGFYIDSDGNEQKDQDRPIGRDRAHTRRRNPDEGIPFGEQHLSEGQQRLLGQVVMTAENYGHHYPSHPAKAVDEAIRSVKGYLNQGLAYDLAEVRPFAVREVQSGWRRKNPTEISFDDQGRLVETTTKREITLNDIDEAWYSLASEPPDTPEGDPTSTALLGPYRELEIMGLATIGEQRFFPGKGMKTLVKLTPLGNEMVTTDSSGELVSIGDVMEQLGI